MSKFKDLYFIAILILFINLSSLSFAKTGTGIDVGAATSFNPSIKFWTKQNLGYQILTSVPTLRILLKHYDQFFKISTGLGRTFGSSDYANRTHFLIDIGIGENPEVILQWVYLFDPLKIGGILIDRGVGLGIHFYY